MKVSVVTPVFNEELNIRELVSRVSQILASIGCINYEHIIIDNDSTDNTFSICRELADEFPNLLLIQNEKNFGFSNSSYYGLIQATGDCAIFLMADLQDPPELIPQMLELWESGAAVVACTKKSSGESKLKYRLRTVYYKIMKFFTDGEHIEHFTGFGLYDKKFIEVLKKCGDSTPYLRGIVCQMGFRIKRLEYVQEARRSGVSKFNYGNLFDLAMLGFISSSRAPLRIAVILGFISSIIFFIVGLAFLTLKILYWDTFQAGVAGIIVALFFIGSIQLFLIGIIAEYVGATFNQTRYRPIVLERDRILSNRGTL